jgi:hypothetical protein
MESFRKRTYTLICFVIEVFGLDIFFEEEGHIHSLIEVLNVVKWLTLYKRINNKAEGSR